MTDTVGFLGLGVLGSAIAENLVSGGLKVIGFDISETARGDAANVGVTLVDTPEAVARAADIVFTCLPNAAALTEAMNGPGGLLSVAAPGQIIVEMSTLALADKMAFADSCIAAKRSPVDCPVSGNRIMALKRKLTAFFSGQEADYQRLQPLLAMTCSKSHFVGAFGNGSKIKFCGNILNLVHNAVAAEAMVLAIKSGIDPKLFHEVISGSGSSSAMFEVRGALMVDEDYQKEGMNFSVPIKDARIISDHAAEMFCPLPIYQVALQNYYAAVAQGHGMEDAAAVCKIMEQAANASRQGSGAASSNDARADDGPSDPQT